MLRLNRNVARAMSRRTFATANSGSYLPSMLSKYPIGLKMHGYEIEDVKPIPEYSIVAVKLKHERTGSEHLHLDSQIDNNNVFSIGFKTNPPDRTGVPHILEHTTLCGSYKYPVKDPFFKMLNRSLSNFMNAMTGHDYTFYPFATTNSKDFDNLMDVYLSSVFEPLLTHEDFTQEGWRLEHEEVGNKESPIIYKGVVYNEMKGQYSNSGYHFWIAFQEAVYPALKNSGGDPKDMTDLNYEDLIEFHSQNYHPSNAKTYTYGNLPLINHLRKLDKTLQTFGRRSRGHNIKAPIFTDPNFTKKFSIKGPVDPLSERPLSEQYKSSITWYLGNPLEESKQYEIFKWKILSSLLCDGHNSNFYQELIEKGYGDDFSVNTGLDATTALLTFNLGLNNISSRQVEELETKLVDIFRSKVMPELSNKDSTFNKRIEAILHQIELNFKKHKPDFGLGLLYSLLPTWVNGLDPISTLQVEEILTRFKDEYESKGLDIFKDMIEKQILENNNQTFQFTMEPYENYNNDMVEQEKQALKNKLDHVTEEDADIILQRGIQLAQKQESEGDESLLPTLTLNDISRQGNFFDLAFSNINSTKLQKRIIETNGLVYATAAKDLSFLPEKYLPYLPLFTSCLTNLAGTSKTSVTDLETKIQSLTGGLSFSVNAITNPYDLGDPKLMFVANGMSLKEKSNNIYEMWEEILIQTNFENESQVLEKLTTLIKNLNQNQLSVIAERGHSFAMSNSNSNLTPTKYVNDVLGGIAQTKFVLSLGSNVEAKGNEYLINEVLPVLNEIKDTIINNGNFKYNLVCDADTMSINEALVERFDGSISKTSKISDLPNSVALLKDRETSSQKTLINLPYQVGYASLSKLGSCYVSKDGASLQVLSQLLTHKHLHSVIREANGAYGGGLNYDGLGGTLSFYSYRDPDALKSINSFKESFKIALNKTREWDEKDLQEAKLSIFQSIDAPNHISSQGFPHFLEGISDEMRQERRENFLDVNSQDLQDVVNKYLVHESPTPVTVIGNRDLLGLKDGNSSSWTIDSLNA